MAHSNKEIVSVYGSGQAPWTVDKIHAVFDRYTNDDVLNFRTLYFVSKEVQEISRQNQFTGLGICRARPIEIEINDGYTMYPLQVKVSDIDIVELEVIKYLRKKYRRV